MAKEFLSFDPQASTDAEFSFLAEADTSRTLVLPPSYEERRTKVERVKSSIRKVIH